MTLLTLKPPARQQSTAIHIDAGIRLDLARIIDAVKKAESIVILYDKGIESIAKDIAGSLDESHLMAVSSGDVSKSLSEVERICSQMLKLRCSRSTALIAIGGGMITDLGGFVASVFMRGIPCVYVPTSMLGMVDASIGGKTGVNLGEAKNIVGTVSHPVAVVIDTELIRSLPDAQLREGLVEVVKIAAAADVEFFQWLERSIEKILKRDPKTVHECIERAVRLKAKIVEEDEQDNFVRLILNFGHTVGHAVEAASAFGLPHGKCVSVGMAAEMSMAGFSDAPRVTGLLQKIDMPIVLPKDYSADQLWVLMKSDKKNAGGKVKMAVPVVIGKAEVRDIEEKKFRALFR